MARLSLAMAAPPALVRPGLTNLVVGVGPDCRMSLEIASSQGLPLSSQLLSHSLFPGRRYLDVVLNPLGRVISLGFRGASGHESQAHFAE